MVMPLASYDPNTNLMKHMDDEGEIEVELTEGAIATQDGSEGGNMQKDEECFLVHTEGEDMS
jgi:hypothetical protein